MLSLSSAGARIIRVMADAEGGSKTGVSQIFPPQYSNCRADKNYPKKPHGHHHKEVNAPRKTHYQHHNGGNQDDAKDQYYHCQYFHTGRVRSLARHESPFKVALTVSYLFLLS